MVCLPQSLASFRHLSEGRQSRFQRFQKSKSHLWQTLTVTHRAWLGGLLSNRAGIEKRGKWLWQVEGRGDAGEMRVSLVESRALIRRAVKRAGPSKKVWYSRLGSNYTLELRCLKNLHETPFYVNRRIFCWIFSSKTMRKGEFFRDENRT